MIIPQGPFAEPPALPQEATMDRRPPRPVVKSFIVCNRIFEDQATRELILLDPRQQVGAAQFPVILRLSIYAHCTGMHGTYHLELQLQDMEGNSLWGQPIDKPLEAPDPLRGTVMRLVNMDVYFAKPGKYDLVLLANGEEIHRDVFCVCQGPVPPF